MEKELKKQLKKYSKIFLDAQEKSRKEADVVMYIVQFFQDALGYDILKKQEISKEYATGGGFCDIAIKIKGKLELIIEVKQPGMKLADSHIRQAKNYAIESGMKWALLTNGCDWKLFHLRYVEKKGIKSTLVFKTDLLKNFQEKPDEVIDKFKLLHKKIFTKGGLDNFWKKKTMLTPNSIVKVLFAEDVLKLIAHKVNYKKEVKVGIEDIAKALKNMFDKEVLADMADIKIVKGKTKQEKPYKVKFLNNTYEIKSWKGLLVFTAEKLLELKPDLMKELSDSKIMQGRKSPYLTKNQSLLRNPSQLSPGLFLETNLSSDGVIKVINILLKGCGYKESDIEIITKK